MKRYTTQVLYKERSSKRCKNYLARNDKNTFLQVGKFLVIILILPLCAINSHGQKFLNGDFEKTSATGDQINLSNDNFNKMIESTYAFGTYGDVDIITSSTYSGGPQNGNWYVALTGGETDIISMELSSALTEGKSYSISFYDKAGSGYKPFPVQIGLSDKKDDFGTVIFTTPSMARDGEWIKRSFTFKAPIQGNYITIRGKEGYLYDWVNFDNFSFDCNLVDLGKDVKLCQGEVLTLDVASPGATYLWQDGSTASSFTVSVPGEYSVEVSNGTCSSSDAINVTYQEKINASAGSDVTVCKGSQVVLHATGGANYQWNTGERNQSVIVNPSSNTVYTVTVSEGRCTASDEIVVNVQQPVLIDAGPDLTLKQGSQGIEMNVVGPEGKYLWQPGTGLSCTECKNPMVSLLDSSITYHLSYTDNNGCISTDSVTVMTSESQGYYVTNPVTPNGDGRNDAFMVSLKKGSNLHFTIYDSSGKLLYKSSDENYEWNGKVNGQLVPPGIYIYSLNYKDNKGSQVQKSGVFTLSY